MPPAVTDLKRRNRHERAWWLVVAIAAVLWVGAGRLQRLEEIEASEAERLQVQVRAIAQNLEQQLDGVAAALRGLRDDLPELQRDDLPRRARLRMEAMCAALPGVRTMLLVDAEGNPVADARPEDWPDAPAVAAWFQRLRARPDASVLYVSPPFRSLHGEKVVNLAVALVGPDGRFEGAVAATLDGAYFHTLLTSVLYAPDMTARIVHADLSVLVATPDEQPDDTLIAERVAEVFGRHLAASQPASVLRARSARGGERLAALRTLSLPRLGMDQPLLLGVGRSVRALRLPWRQQTEVIAASLLGALVASGLGLLALQRRRSEREAAAAASLAREQSDAERLRLALHGADLALWDVNLVTGQPTVNERWATMLGYTPGAPGGTGSEWESLLHPEDRSRVLALQQQHLEGHSPVFEASYRLRHHDGHWVWVLDRGRVVQRDAQGKPMRMVGTHLDITARVQAEDELRRSEHKSRALLAALHSGVVLHAPDGAVLDANPAACRILGLSVEQMRDKAARAADWQVIDEDGQPMAPERHPVQRVVDSGQVVNNLVVGIRRPDRPQPVWALCVAFPLHGTDGALQEIVVTFYDITERQHAEAQQRRTAARLRMASRLARLGGWRLEQASEHIWLSQEAAALLGLDPARPVSLSALLKPLSESRRAEILALARGHQAFELEAEWQRDRTAGPRLLRVLGEPEHDEQGRLVAMQGALQDVTESRQEQQQLRLLQTAVAQLNDVVLISEAAAAGPAHDRVVFVNEAFERLSGRSGAEVLGAAPELAGVGAAVGAGAGPDVGAGEGPVAVSEKQLQRRDGSSYWVEEEVVPLRAADGRITHHVTVQRDISDRKQAEARAHAAQQDLAATLEAVPDLLFELDPEGRFRNYHSPRNDLLYVAPEAFMGLRVADVMPAAVLAVVEAAMREALEKGYSGGRQYELPLGSGTRCFELSMSLKRLTPEAPPHFIALARDITERQQGELERRALERQLREAQKIESIGTLAGGIAHDFNNILPAILGNVALARQDLAAGHPALASLEQIHTAGQRARTLVQQILTFSRRQPQALVVQPLQPVIEETLSLLRATLPAAVKLETAITSQMLLVEADATQLQQVVMNLCTNAWHSLPESRGRIEVGLALREADLAPAAEGGVPTGPRAHLWVADNGSGMAPEVLERIFDPFFTTKPVGQGTGLGLSVVHGIVRLLRGSISVHSTPGQGSRFELLLPLAVAGAVVSSANVGPSAGPVRGGAGGGEGGGGGGGERVLYVDDDEVMGLMVQRLLQREGYDVTGLVSPAQALARLREDPMGFDLVISDFNMPEMSGTELAAQLRTLRPALPVLISSGYISDALREQAAVLGVRALLQKEQTLEALPALVRQVLASA